MKLTPVWSPEACVPRREILEGTLTDADLALSLSAVVQGRAKPPYDDPFTFYEATHQTRNLKLILDNILGRLTNTRAEVNPIIVLDVGFGGGKTHALVALYYAAIYASDPRLTPHLKDLPRPVNVAVAAISGEECGDQGIIYRGDQTIKTLWGDICWQLGSYQQFRQLDEEELLPTLDQTRAMLSHRPVLILLDELPSYMIAVSSRGDKLDKTVQFIQRLVLAVSEKSDASLVIAIAEDAYKSEAELAKRAVSEAEKAATREAMEDARAHIRRKELILVPVQEEEVVHILKRRLFQHIEPAKAREAAEAYSELYRSLATPEMYKRETLKDEVEAYYPFHPMLVRTLYGRLATLDRFQRTRGSLRLLSRIIRRMWAEKEHDAYLIHPHHVDLADEGVMNDLTTGIGEERMKNALEADVWSADGLAVAQELDNQSMSHWGAPLVRRACNTVYLYSLSAGREGSRGVSVDELATLLAVPEHQDYYMRVRDTVTQMLSDEFGYLERRGDQLLFVREQTPIRIIERESRGISDTEVIQTIQTYLIEMFKERNPAWLHVEIFPSTPSAVSDEPLIQLVILNPLLYDSPEAGKASPRVEAFLRYRDDLSQRPRHNLNSLIVLTSVRERFDQLRKSAQRLKATEAVRDNMIRYNISLDRKREIEEYHKRQLGYLYDNIRKVFARVTYFQDPNKIETRNVESLGWGDAKKGRDVFAHYLKEVIYRVKDEPLDPDYVMDEAWPRGAGWVSTGDLYQQFHVLAGLIIPATKELYVKALERGLDQSRWVLKQGEAIYTAQKKPGNVRVDDATLLYTLEAAERSGLLEEKPTVTEVKGPSRPSQLQTHLSPRQLLNFGDSNAETLASSLEARMKRDQLNMVDDLTLRVRGPLINILHLRNLLTRIAPEKTVQFKLSGRVTKPQSPQYTLSFELNERDAQSEEGRWLLDTAWRAKGCEGMDVMLKLSWPEGAGAEAAAKLIRSLGSDTEPFMASMDVNASRRSA